MNLYPRLRVGLSGITPPFGGISLSSGKVPMLYSAVCRGSNPLDLHVLGAPPAFTLSQDQTLRKDSLLLRATNLEKRFVTRDRVITSVSSFLSASAL